MTEHLPECTSVDRPVKPRQVRGLCICDRLREAERRVIAEAREAVAAVPDRCDEIGGYSFDEAVEWCLAAIDGLKGEPS